MNIRPNDTLHGIGDFMIHHGDCFEIMQNYVEAGVKVDCIITDPPYELTNNGGGIGNNDFTNRKLVKERHLNFISKGFDYEKCFELFLKLQDIPNILIFCSNNQVSKTMKWFEDRKLITTLLVWNKTNPVPLCNGKHLSDVEFVVYVRGKGETFNNEVPFDFKRKVYTSPIVSNKNRLHPTQKSVEHIERFIQLHTKVGDAVFDPFMGSGTKGVASIKLRRQFIGCEIDMNYFKSAYNRLMEVEK